MADAVSLALKTEKHISIRPSKSMSSFRSNYSNSSKSFHVFDKSPACSFFPSKSTPPNTASTSSSISKAPPHLQPVLNVSARPNVGKCFRCNQVGYLSNKFPNRRTVAHLDVEDGGDGILRVGPSSTLEVTLYEDHELVGLDEGEFVDC